MAGMEAGAGMMVRLGGLKVYCACATSCQAPPLTLTLRLPPSKLGSVATQWSTVRRGAMAPFGKLIAGPSRWSTPASLLVALHVPIVGLGPKKAAPGRRLGRVALSDQSREVKSGVAPS